MIPQRLQLPLAVIVLAIFAIVAWRTWGDPEAAGGRAGSGRSARLAQQPFTAADVPVVKGLRLQGGFGEGEGRDRDLFEYAKSPEEIEAERLAAEEARRLAEERARQARLDAERRAQEEAERRRREAEEARRRALAEARARADEQTEETTDEPPPPEPPDFTYRFVGIIGPRGDAYAILQDDEEDFVYAKAGDVLDDAFRVQRVGRLKMDLSFVDPIFAGEVTEVPREFGVDTSTAGGRAAPRGRNRT